MKSRTVMLAAALLMLLYAGAVSCIQHQWERSCIWYVAQDTPVYIPGAADEIAFTLPAGTGCRVGASVGDTWQAIEYMIGGRTCTGMVRADSLRIRSPQSDANRPFY